MSKRLAVLLLLVPVMLGLTWTVEPTVKRWANMTTFTSNPGATSPGPTYGPIAGWRPYGGEAVFLCKVYPGASTYYGSYTLEEVHVTITITGWYAYVEYSGAFSLEGYAILGSDSSLQYSTGNVLYDTQANAAAGGYWGGGASALPQGGSPAPSLYFSGDWITEIDPDNPGDPPTDPPTDPPGEGEVPGEWEDVVAAGEDAPGVFQGREVFASGNPLTSFNNIGTQLLGVKYGGHQGDSYNVASMAASVYAGVLEVQNMPGYIALRAFIVSITSVIMLWQWFIRFRQILEWLFSARGGTA